MGGGDHGVMISCDVVEFPTGGTSVGAPVGEGSHPYEQCKDP